MPVGARVVRGPNWSLGDEDGGSNHTGTVTAVLPGGDRVTVRWDMGATSTCRAGHSGPRDLTVFDLAPAGVRHQHIICDECSEREIRGIRWKCTICDDFDLCTPCYLEDAHKTTHAFTRIDYPGADPVKVAKRSVSQRLRVFGMFPHAEVVRGPDWNSDDQDGGQGNTGVVGDIVSYRQGELRRDAVSVTWGDDGSPHVYRVGYQGKMDLVCQEKSAGPDYYPDHLPTLDATSMQAIEADQKPKQSDDKIVAGDSVCVDMVKAEFAAIQKRQLRWNDTMEEMIGQILKVQYVTSEGDCVVEYYDMTTVLAKDVVKKVPVHNKRDHVKVIDSSERLRRLQKNHGGWTDGMDKVLGRTGRVTVIDSDGDVGVTFGDVEYVLHPLCLVPMTSTDGTTSLSSDDEEDGAVGGGDDDNDFDDILDLGLEPRREPTSDTSRKTGRRQDSDSDGDDAMDLLQGFAGLLLLRSLARQGGSDVKVDFVKAVVNGNDRVVKTLLQRHSGLKSVTYKGSPCLVLAAIQEHYDVVKVILEAGVDIDQQDDNGVTALMVAMNKENNLIARFLVNHNAKVDTQNVQKRTALHIAARGKFMEGVQMLLARGADINIQDVTGDTPLHDAIDKKHDDIAKLLIRQANLDVWIKNEKEFTTLAYACLKQHNVSLVALMSKEPRLVTSVNGRSSGGFSPLHIAAINDHCEVAKLLLESGKADVDAVSDALQTALHVAAERGYINMIQLLIKFNADISIKDLTGDTALHVCLQGRQTTGDLFLRLIGLDSDSLGDIGERLKIAELLIQRGASVEATNRSGETPLEACSNPRLRMQVERLVERERLASRGAQGLLSLFKKKCRRCTSALADVRFIPCDHVVTCRRCCRSYNRCPVCNRLILKVAL